MKILVTGGAGFIGSHIVDSYVSNGHDVVVIDNLDSGKKELINEKAVFYNIDILSKELDKIFEKEKFDVVNHCAAQINVRISVEKPLFDAKINVLGILNVLENCRKYSVKKIIFPSSAGIYGNQNNYPFSEDISKEPFSPYIMSKKICEDYLKYYSNISDMKYIILRYSNVYGPRQNSHGDAGVISIFFDSLLGNKNVKIYGDGEQIRDYVFISDIVNANNIVLDKGDNDCFNIGTGIPTTVNQLYNKMKEITNSSSNVVNFPIKEGDVKVNYLNFDKAKKILDWEPKINLDEGLKLTYEWFKN